MQPQSPACTRLTRGSPSAQGSASAVSARDCCHLFTQLAPGRCSRDHCVPAGSRGQGAGRTEAPQCALSHNACSTHIPLVITRTHTHDDMLPGCISVTTK